VALHMPGAVVRSADDIAVAWRSALSCCSSGDLGKMYKPNAGAFETDRPYSKAQWIRAHPGSSGDEPRRDRLPGARTRPAFVEGSSSNESTSAMSRTAGAYQRKPYDRARPGGCADWPTGRKDDDHQLIPRFYDPISGAVKIDGSQCGTTASNRFVGQISVVLQESMLFQAGLRTSLTESRTRAARDSSRAELANAHELSTRCRSATTLSSASGALPLGRPAAAYRHRRGLFG